MLSKPFKSQLLKYFLILHFHTMFNKCPFSNLSIIKPIKILMFLNGIMFLLNLVPLCLVCSHKKYVYRFLLIVNAHGIPWYMYSDKLFCQSLSLMSGETGNPSLLLSLPWAEWERTCVLYCVHASLVLDGADLEVRRVFCDYAISLYGGVCSPPYCSVWMGTFILCGLSIFLFYLIVFCMGNL